MDNLEHVAYRYHAPDEPLWAYAPVEDREDMEALAERGWDVERLFVREVEEDE
mgnify:CR=1 FL=1